MSPDIPLEILKWFFQFGLIGTLVGLMVLYAIFRGWHYVKLLSGDSEKHKPVFEEASDLIRSEHWGTRYRVFLQKILEVLTHVIGDNYRFPDELPEKPRLQADDPAIEQIYKNNYLRRVLGVYPFTVESYQFCFLLALLYPILSFTVGWVMSGNGFLGSLKVMPDVSLLTRLEFLVVLVASIMLALCSRKLSYLKPTGVAVSALGGAVAIGGGVGVVFGVAISDGGSVGAAIAVGVVIGGSIAASLSLFVGNVFAVGVAAIFAVGTAIIIAVGVAVGAVLTWYMLVILAVGLLALLFVLLLLYNKARKENELATYWFVYSLVFLTASLAILNWIDNTGALLLLLFYLILPLVNAPLDWLSLGITRALLQSIRFNHHRSGKALAWSLLDLGLAVVALLLVSGVMVSVVSLANLLAIKPIIDLQALFISLSSLDNWQDNLWIYFMLLSTLIPTAIHFALAGGALTLAVSNKQRKSILKDIETNDLSAKKAWIYVSVMPAFGFVLAPTILLFGLYWILHTHGAFLGNALLSWAELLAIWIDPTLGQLPKLIGA